MGNGRGREESPLGLLWGKEERSEGSQISGGVGWGDEGKGGPNPGWAYGLSQVTRVKGE